MNLANSHKKKLRKVITNLYIAIANIDPQKMNPAQKEALSDIVEESWKKIVKDILMSICKCFGKI